MSKITIVVMEDHKMIRDMWRKLFFGDSEIEIVGESGDFEEGLSLVKQKKPGIVFLDINFPDASGFDAVERIKVDSPGTRIIVVSMHNHPQLAKKMFKLGVKGYVTKNSGHDEVIHAIRLVNDGGTYVCAEIKNKLAEMAFEEEGGRQSIDNLSGRELEIVHLLKEGCSSKDIAEKLNVSFNTIEAHRHNILKKMGVKNTAALIHLIKSQDPSF